MNPNREELLFQLALTKPAGERALWLDRECGDQRALRARLEALLAAHEQSEWVLAETAPAAKATMKIEFADAPDEAVGQKIGRYKILEKVGEGGCGVVYVAEQTEPVRRRVALKVIKLGMDTKQVVARFEAERQALAMMDHPNIAKVLDAGTVGGSDSQLSTPNSQLPQGRPFFVMELVRGIRITDYCDQANLSTKERLDLFIKVCQAIQHAHQKGIIHRDIKPSNILVTLHDGAPVPKVIDFGIAKATEGRLTDNTVYTQLHQFIGTPAYMSPEQAEMSGLDIDTRSDIYSLGVLLYELLAGSTPFDAKELMASGIDAMRKTIREKEPVRPSTKLATLQGEELTTTAKRRSVESSKLAKLLRGDLDWIVMKCLEKDRARRYDTANGLAADIRRHLNNEPVVARPPSKLYEFQKTFRRHKVGFAATAALIAVLLAGVVVSAWQAARARRAETEQSRLRVTAQAAEVDARTKQSEAEVQRKRADEETSKARENLEYSRRLLYASDINLAQQALTLNNLGRARRLLNRHRPKPGEEDLRGWEWRYLWQLTRSEALTTLVNRPTYGTDVCFSPDGNWLAVGWQDGQVGLWNIPARKSIRTLSSPKNSAVGRVAFSPMANLLAANSAPGTVKLHELDSGKELFLWTAPDDAGWIVKDLAFSHDGSRVIIYGECIAKKVSSVWIANISGRIENRFPSRFYLGWDEMGTARLSPDNRRLYLETPGGDCTIQCIDLATGKKLWRTEIMPDGALTALAVSPDGDVLASATGFTDSTIRLWNAETGQHLDRLNGHTVWVSDLQFTKDGKQLVSASSDQTIRLWDTHDWTETRVLRGHTDEVHALAVSEPANLIASVSKNGDLMLWPMEGKSLAQGYTRLPDNLGAQSVLPLDQARALVSRGSSPPALIDFKEDLRPHDLPGLNSPDSFLSLTDTNLICHWDGTNQIVVSELRGMKLIRRGGVTIESGKRPSGALYDARHDLLAWTEPTPSMLVHVASLDGAGRRIELKRDFPSIIPTQINDVGTHLVALARFGALNVWNLQTTATVIARREKFSGAFFAAGGRVLVAVALIGNDHEVLFYDLARPDKPLGQIRGRDQADGLSVSPDGSLVAVSTHAGLLELYNPTNGTLIRSLDGHLNSAFDVAFSRDGQRLVSASGGREALKLWDVITRQELLNLSGVGGVLHKPIWSGDGNVLMVRQPWQAWIAPSWEEINAVDANEKEETKQP